MDVFFTVLIALLVFGFLIFIHEFGHYITARIFNVSITEFSIGMGPALLSYTSKKTGILYSLRIFPIGGFVAMVGEDEESDDPNAFNKKPAWQRFIVTAAGAFVNIVAGFLATVILVSMIDIGGTTVGRFCTEEELSQYGELSYSQSSEAQGLMLGDRILSVNGTRVEIYDELSYEVMRHGYKPVDLVVLRDGEEVPLSGVSFPTITQQGQVFGFCDFLVYGVEKDFGTTLSLAFKKACLIVRTCWESIYDLVTGRYGIGAVSGPVGISGAIGDAVQNGGIAALLNITIMISINLGFMNLLPIPALDGGRLIVLLVEMISRKKLPPRIEAAINGVGLMLLLLLSVLIMVKDFIQLF